MADSVFSLGTSGSAKPYKKPVALCVICPVTLPASTVSVVSAAPPNSPLSGVPEPTLTPKIDSSAETMIATMRKTVFINLFRLS